jgi:hypothetical protein
MRWLPVFVCGLLVFEMASAVGQETLAPKLNIVIVEGEGAINNIRQRTAREPIVQVEDENHRPVAGALVLFTLPSNGAGGAFANGTQTLTVVTDQQGRAIAQGLRPNQAAGQLQIRVDASYQGQTAHAVVNQTNTATNAAKPRKVSAKVLVILAVVAAVAAGGTVAAVYGGGPSKPAGTVITPGTGSVGAPH